MHVPVLTEWALLMQCIGKIGTVHRITERGDIRVQYEGANNRWTFHAGSLTKVKRIAVYDVCFCHFTIMQNVFYLLSLLY